VLRNIAVPALAPVPAFELGVVCEAFGLDHTPPGLPAYDFAVCGEQVTPVPTTSGFAVLPGHDLSRLADADLIIVLGAAPPAPPPPAMLVRQLRDAVARGATVASACTGAFVLAAAGLLDGRRVTTHWLYAPLLASLYPQLRVETDRVPEPGTADELAQVLQWALLHLDQPLTVDALAARASMSPRTFARRFRQRTGRHPRLVGVRCPDTLRRHFTQARGVTPSQYRRAFRLT
jgi:transcriptional regulator GlxA family with amidase domain